MVTRMGTSLVTTPSIHTAAYPCSGRNELKKEKAEVEQPSKAPPFSFVSRHDQDMILLGKAPACVCRPGPIMAARAA